MSNRYFQHSDENHFVDISLIGDRLRVRRGIVGKPCLVIDVTWRGNVRAANDSVGNIIERLTSGGYRECLPSVPIIDGSHAIEVWSDQIQSDSPYYEALRLGGRVPNRSRAQRLLVFPKGLRYKDHLDLGEIIELNLDEGLIVEGDVRVHGVFSELYLGYSATLLVTGNVYAHSLGSKNGHIMIKGDVDVENVVYGEYNDGVLEVGGDAHGRLWVNYDHDMRVGGSIYVPDLAQVDSQDLSPKLLDLAGRFDYEALRALMLARKSPFRSTYVAHVLEPRLQTPPDVNAQLWRRILELSDAENTTGIVDLLATWPYRNEPWTQHVRSYISSTSLSYPQRLQLATLLPRNVPVNRPIASLEEAHPRVEAYLMTSAFDPDAALETLKEPFDESVLRTHGSWLLGQAVEDIRSHGASRVPHLERLLSMGADPSARDFAGRTAWQDAIDHELNDAIALMQRYRPDLTMPTKPLPGLLVLAQLEQWQDTNEDLNTPDKQAWLESIHTLEAHSRKLTRVPSLAPLKNLEYIDLQECALKVLPEGLLELKHLQVLLLSGNKALEKLVDSGKDNQIAILTELQKRGVALVKDVDNSSRLPRRVHEALQEVRRLNRQGSELQTEDPAQALNAFAAARALAEAHTIDYQNQFSEPYLVALDASLACLLSLAAREPSKFEDAKALAQKIATLQVEDSHAYDNVSDDVLRATQVRTHTTLARIAASQSRLEKALQHARAAVRYIDVSQPSALANHALELLAQSLKALGHTEDLHGLTYQVRKRIAHQPFFEQLATNPDYVDWNRLH